MLSTHTDFGVMSFNWIVFTINDKNMLYSYVFQPKLDHTQIEIEYLTTPFTISRQLLVLCY